jgi:hypothetical protein
LKAPLRRAAASALSTKGTILVSIRVCFLLTSAALAQNRGTRVLQPNSTRLPHAHISMCNVPHHSVAVTHLPLRPYKQYKCSLAVRGFEYKPCGFTVRGFATPTTDSVFGGHPPPSLSC